MVILLLLWLSGAR